MKTYTGERTLDGIRVLVDGEPLNPRYDVKVFSDGDFEWAYEGDEPAQLSLALLMDHFNDSRQALAYCDAFMREIVANLDNDWELTTADIDAAIADLSADTQSATTD